MGISKNGGCPKVTCQWNHDDKQWRTWTCVKHQHPEAFVERRKQMLEETAAWRMLEGNLWRFSQVLFGSPVGTCWDLAVCRFPKICCGGSWNRCQGKGSPLVDRIIWRRCWCCRPWFRPGLGLIFCCWVWRKDQGVPGFLSFPHFKRCSNDLRSRLYKSETTIFRSWNPHIFPNFSPFFPQFFPIFPHFLRCKSPWTSHFQGSLNGLPSRPRMAWFGPFWMRTKQLRWCPGAYEPWDVHEILSDFKVLYINILDSGTVEC